MVQNDLEQGSLTPSGKALADDTGDERLSQDFIRREVVRKTPGESGPIAKIQSSVRKWGLSPDGNDDDIYERSPTEAGL